MIQMRSNRGTVLVVGAVVFLAALVGLAYNHLDSFELPAGGRISPSGGSKSKNATADELINFYIKHIQKPLIKVDDPTYVVYGAFDYNLPESDNPKWTEDLGEEFCIIDLDNRPFETKGQLWAEEPMNYHQGKDVHGLSMGFLNHWLYAKIHGYKYYYVEIEEYEDRRASWKKPPIMSKILKKHKACVFLDSDAIFHHLDLPFEWLMNYWQLHPKTNSLALAADPGSDNNKDKFGKVYLNTGFIIAQNNEKTYEIFDAWQDCPNDGGDHPECTEFRLNRPGKPTDQGGFGTYIRYDFPKDIKQLDCNEANGFPESHSSCDGIFVKHLWTGKSDWIKVAVGEQLPGDLLPTFHKQFQDEKKDYYITEAQLMSETFEKTGHA